MDDLDLRFLYGDLVDRKISLYNFYEAFKTDSFRKDLINYINKYKLHSGVCINYFNLRRQFLIKDLLFYKFINPFYYINILKDVVEKCLKVGKLDFLTFDEKQLHYYAEIIGSNKEDPFISIETIVFMNLIAIDMDIIHDIDDDTKSIISELPNKNYRTLTNLSREQLNDYISKYRIPSIDYSKIRTKIAEYSKERSVTYDAFLRSMNEKKLLNAEELKYITAINYEYTLGYNKPVYQYYSVILEVNMDYIELFKDFKVECNSYLTSKQCWQNKCRWNRKNNRCVQNPKENYEDPRIFYDKVTGKGKEITL